MATTRGLTYAVSHERFGKQLELLKLAVGRLGRVAVLWDIDPEIFRRFWATPLAEAGRTLNLEVQPPTLERYVQDLSAAFALMKRQQADAVLVATHRRPLASGGTCDSVSTANA